MKEFGSDFQYINSYDSGRAHLTNVFRDAVLLASGRQCIVSLIRQYGWKRVWIPDYFCYEVIETIKEQTSVKVVFYEDTPLSEGTVTDLPFQGGDVLLRMNYFGLRNHRSNKCITVPVIEDHSHDPFGHWALYSDADWCISSIRKILPIPEGGMMWSPKGNALGVSFQPSKKNEQIAAIRWEGMEMKAKYLNGEDNIKNDFRKKYTETEEWFDKAEPSLIDDRSRNVVSEELDINLWQGAKRKNWNLLKSLVEKETCRILEPEDESCTMFSLVLLFESKKHREAVRKKLIEASVYPAILWTVSSCASMEARSFSDRMLSVHCDGRYQEEDVRQLAEILNLALK